MRVALVALVVALAAARAEAGRGTSLLRYLPDDATSVLVADVAQGRATPLFGKLASALRGKFGWWDAVATAGTFDDQVETVVVGGSDDHYVAVLEGKLDPLVAAVTAGRKGVRHAGVSYWSVPAGEVALIDHHLVFTSPGDMAATIDRARGKPRGRGAGKLRGLLAFAGPGAALYGADILSAQRRAELMQGLGAEPTAVVFSVAAATSAVVEIDLAFADEAGASRAAPAVSGQLGSARPQLESFVGKDFSDSVSVAQDHQLVQITGTLTTEEADKLLPVVQWM